MRDHGFLLLLLALGGCPGGEDDTGSPIVDADGDGALSDVDCNDEDGTILPGAPETCDGVDNDCDGEVDEDDAANQYAWYADADGDGYGDPDQTIRDCTMPAGAADNDQDCDDADADVHPGAPEDDCTDPIDYNCDGSTGWADADSDGYAACEDCDDADATVHPGATEVPYDGEDDDCDPLTRDDDLDGDGHDLDEDCDDGDASVSPTAPEVYYDGVDNDCDPLTRDDDLDGDGHDLDEDCNDADDEVHPGATEVPYDGQDNDCNPATLEDDLDGDGYAEADDCDDADEDVHPGAVEIPYDDADNDCDPSTSEDDLDGDGYGAGEDCDDADGDRNPGETEVPYDGIDNDCNSATRENDLDGDGHALIDDCDDEDQDAYPGAPETYDDSVDQDCNGHDTITCVLDDDEDGYGTEAGTPAYAPDGSCDTADGEATNDEDCDDGDDAVNPDASEIWYDGTDQDCDDGSDWDQDGDGHDVLGHTGGNDCDDLDDGLWVCGTTPATAMDDCDQLHDTYPSLPDGSYWIDGNMSPLLVQCEMDDPIIGGGWTVVELCTAYNSLGGNGAGALNAVVAAPIAGFDTSCRPFAQDQTGDHFYTYTFNFPPVYTEFVLRSFQMRAYAASGNTSDMNGTQWDQVGRTWTAHPAAGTNCYGDVAYGSGNDAGPVTSYAHIGTVLSCTNCTTTFDPAPAGGLTVYAVGSPSSSFRMSWNEECGEYEGWYPWYSGQILLR